MNIVHIYLYHIILIWIIHFHAHYVFTKENIIFNETINNCQIQNNNNINLYI